LDKPLSHLGLYCTHRITYAARLQSPFYPNSNSFYAKTLPHRVGSQLAIHPANLSGRARAAPLATACNSLNVAKELRAFQFSCCLLNRQLAARAFSQFIHHKPTDALPNLSHWRLAKWAEHEHHVLILVAVQAGSQGRSRSQTEWAVGQPSGSATSCLCSTKCDTCKPREVIA
jgi:hypothetical protein